MSIVQPSRVTLKTCIIGSTPHIDFQNNNIKENFTVHSIRIYEDICKAYFTAQLLIEDQINQTDPYIYPATEVLISWTVEPTNKTYTEKFRIYSIESKPKDNDLYAGMLITLNLIGDEYYNDTQNTVMQNFPNITATQAAAQIHNTYIAENGPISVIDSIGLVGKTDHPHEVTNMQPIKAIHDLLDKAVKGTSAFVYFRNKPGYVIGPLQELMETGSINGNFIHKPGQGAQIKDVLTGYNNIIHFRPMAPPSQETAQGIRNAELDSLMKTSSFFDIKSGQYIQNVSGLTSRISTGISSLDGLFKEVFNKSVKSPFGARLLFNAINQDRQELTVDKNGPAGHKAAEEAFLAALSYSKKYWVVVPMQSGINVTIGNRINCVYPVGERPTAKTLFVARLIHCLNFKTPSANRYEPSQGTTEIYAVNWN